MGRNNFIPGQFYGSVQDASAPLSANTEFNVCSICPDGGSLKTPHAVYTNAQGKDIVQLDTVVLGGPNGVNN